MTYLLIIIIVLLIGTILFLNIQIYNQKKIFQNKLKELHKIIIESNKKHALQKDQIYLSKELEERIKTINATLSNTIFGLNFDLFNILSENDLLKK